MREPAFWHRPPSWLARLLMPFGAIYGAVAAQRLKREGINAGIPVLCVGNFTLGGAGKTPTVLAVAKLLNELGEVPVVLSRGYGGSLQGPVKVDALKSRRFAGWRRATDDGVKAARGGLAGSRRRRRIGAVAGRERHRDG